MVFCLWLNVIFLSHPKNNPLRASIVMLAITASLALVIVLSSLSIGIRESSKISLDNVGADMYVVPEDLHPLLMDLQRFDQGWSVQREIENSLIVPQYLSPRLSDTLFYSFEDTLGEVNVFGIEPGKEDDFHQFRTVRGSWFSTLDDPLRMKYIDHGTIDEGEMTYEVMISMEFQRSTGLRVGDKVSLTPSLIYENGSQFTIEGVFVDTLSRLSRSILVHLGELQYLKGLLERDTLTEILLDYNDNVDTDDVEEWSKSDDFTFRDIVDIIPKRKILEDIYGFLGIINGFTAMVIGITLFICLIFTSTIFMISAKERSRDTSILRAIGIPSWRIFQWVIMESTLFYGVGTVIGVSLGAGAIYVLNLILMEGFPLLPEGFKPFMYDGSVIVLAVVLSFILAISSSLLPAIRTSLISPMGSLRGDVS